VDCVINNAGLWIEGPLDELDPARIHEVLEVNTLGTINLTKAVIPGMKRQKAGRIININSQAGLYAKAGRGVYNASKWAVTGFTKSLQEELAPFGIGVTGMYPGKLDTGLFEKAGTPKNMADALDPQEVAKTIEFMLSMDNTILFTEIGVKHLEG
jgi:short-subunit dehydrogenase